MKKLYLILLILSSFNTTFATKGSNGSHLHSTGKAKQNKQTPTIVKAFQNENKKNKTNNLKVLNIAERRKETEQDKALMSRIKNSELSASMRAIVWSWHYPY